jgi:large subunit ribosomal protein L11
MEIVNMKIADLNTDDKEKAAKIVEGSARSIGIDVEA